MIKVSDRHCTDFNILFTAHTDCVIGNIMDVLIQKIEHMVALGAMSQGKWSCVDKCIKASGETLLLMLLRALQHDRVSLLASADAQATSQSMHTLAMLLLAADSRIGLRVTVQKDWQIHRCDAVYDRFIRVVKPSLLGVGLQAAVLFYIVLH